MQEEINQKTMVISVKTLKLTGRLLKKLLLGLLRMLKKQRVRSQVKKPEKGIKHGKQKLKNLQKQGRELTSVEITDDNIGSFGKYARKYNIDYSLMKDSSEEPPRWYVFFKASDVKVMEAAFREYANETLPKKKPSIKKKLHLFKTKQKQAPQKQQHRTRTKVKNRSHTR